MNTLSFRNRILPVFVVLFALAAGCCMDSSTQMPGKHGLQTGEVLDRPIQVGDIIQLESKLDLKTTPLAYTISTDGTITLPLLATNVTVVGKHPRELEAIINELYARNGHFRNSDVDVRVTLGSGYYYVTGGVKKPGKQLYTGHVTALGAVRAAGGFNNFAAWKRLKLTRQDGKVFFEDCKRALKDPSLDLEVFPGDRIFVDWTLERWIAS